MAIRRILQFVNPPLPEYNDVSERYRLSVEIQPMQWRGYPDRFPNACITRFDPHTKLLYRHYAFLQVLESPGVGEIHYKAVLEELGEAFLVDYYPGDSLAGSVAFTQAIAVPGREAPSGYQIGMPGLMVVFTDEGGVGANQYPFSADLVGTGYKISNVALHGFLHSDGGDERSPHGGSIQELLADPTTCEQIQDKLAAYFMCYVQELPDEAFAEVTEITIRFNGESNTTTEGTFHE